jgi:hypothetical protein
MATQLKKYLSSIAIGIRFGPSFSICDALGKFSDHLLYSEDSFFNSKLFPLVTKGPLEIRLENPKTGDYLSLSSQDLILSINFADIPTSPDPNLSPKFKKESLKQIYDGFEYILRVLRDYDFDRIQRLGYVAKYLFDDPNLSRSATHNTIGNTIDGVTEVVLRFSKKYPVPEALIKKNIANYQNVNITMAKRPEIDDLFISLDYQEFYDPTLSGTSNLHFPDFITKMEDFNKGTFSNWLTALGEKQVD